MAEAGESNPDEFYGICSKGQRKQSELDVEKVGSHDLDAVVYPASILSAITDSIAARGSF